MKLYAEDSSDSLLSSKYREIDTRIESENEDYLLNVGEAQYIEFLKNFFTLDFPEIHTDKEYVDSYETEIPGSWLPEGFHVSDPNKLFKRMIIVYRIPYTGDITLLRYRPNTFTTAIGLEIELEESTKTIKLDYINYYNVPSQIKQAYDESVRRIFSCYNNLKKEIDAYNTGLEVYIRSSLNKRKKRIFNRGHFLAELGVPVKKNDHTPKTYAVPNPKLREKISIKPSVHSEGYKPEPTLDDDNYQKILKIINDVGKNFERLPSVFSGKGEEDLRDHILMTLDPNFEYGSASGETFNNQVRRIFNFVMTVL